MKALSWRGGGSSKLGRHEGVEQGKTRHRLVTRREGVERDFAPGWGRQYEDDPGDGRGRHSAVRVPTRAVMTLLIPPRMLKSPTTSIHTGLVTSLRSSRIRLTARS